MLHRIKSRITPSGVIATIALFVALGGGYATAFSGSGTLQKAALEGVSASFENARTLNGFGTLQARCDLGDEEIEYRINNTIGKAILWRAFRMPGGASDEGVVEPGAMGVIGIGSGGPIASMRIHLFKGQFVGEASKHGVDIVASNHGPFNNDCDQAAVQIMALNTVQ